MAREAAEPPDQESHGAPAREAEELGAAEEQVGAGPLDQGTDRGSVQGTEELGVAVAPAAGHLPDPGMRGLAGLAAAVAQVAELALDQMLDQGVAGLEAAVAQAAE